MGNVLSFCCLPQKFFVALENNPNVKCYLSPKRKRFFVAVRHGGAVECHVDKMNPKSLDFKRPVVTGLWDATGKKVAITQDQIDLIVTRATDSQVKAIDKPSPQ